MNEATKILTVDIKVSPCFKHTFRRVGIRTKVILNTTGGMAGGYEVLFGEFGKAKRIKGFVSLYLTENKRFLEINPTMISKIEDVIVWEETLHHNNPNGFPNPIVSYFQTPLDVKDIVSSGNHGYDDKKTGKQFDAIDEKYC